jgi:hypothetical protein
MHANQPGLSLPQGQPLSGRYLRGEIEGSSGYVRVRVGLDDARVDYVRTLGPILRIVLNNSSRPSLETSTNAYRPSSNLMTRAEPTAAREFYCNGLM